MESVAEREYGVGHVGQSLDEREAAARGCLQIFSAEAMYLTREVGGAPGPGSFIFGPEPTRLQVVEEFIHMSRHRARAWQHLSAEGMIKEEIEVQHQLMGLIRSKRWTNREMGEIQRNLAYWTEELRRLGN